MVSVMELRRRVMMQSVSQPQDENLIHVDELLDNTVWWNANCLTGYNGWCTTPKIPVIPGETYTLQRDSRDQNGSGQSYVSMFDSSQSFLRKANWQDSRFGGWTGQIDSDVYYVGITIGMTYKDTAVFKKV